MSVRFASALGVLLVLPAVASADGLVDHRALYAMTLAHTTPGSDVQGLTGQMVLEVKSTCEGSAVTQMIKTNTWGDDGAVDVGELTASSYESNDGKTFRFSLHNEIDGNVVDDFEGQAMRPGPDAAGKIVYDKNAYPATSLPAGVIFPNAYTNELIKAADASKKVVSVTVFDGAEESKIFNSTSIIGVRSDAPASAAAQLAGIAHWPVALSYFLVGSSRETPDYESSFDMYANGVSDHVVIDYGDFAMKGDITNLEYLAMPKCK